MRVRVTIRRVKIARIAVIALAACAFSYAQDAKPGRGPGTWMQVAPWA